MVVKWLAVLLFSAGLLTLSIGETGWAQNRPHFLDNELLVGFRSGVSRKDAEKIHGAIGAELIEEFSRINVHRIRIAPAALQAAKKHLSQRPEIKFVEENARLAPDFIPNDPTYGSEWHLAKINVDMAWDISQGTPSVIVAILDSGLDAFHPEFFEKLVPGYNFFDNNSNTADVYGHGTMVAGAAAASCNNGIGVASPACKNLIMPIRVTDTQGYGYYSSIAQGLTWAVDHGAKVMNISFAGVASSSTIKSAAQYARSRGGVVVAAAGNCGCFDSTLENPYILSVSATDGSDSLASWSSQGAYVDVSAPGAGIYTTTSGGGYAAVSGTSFASPVTAGVVALMMSVNPALSPAETESLLEANTDDRGSSGYDTAYGHGRINAYRSVAAAATNGPVIDNIAPVANIDSPSNGSTASGGLSISVSAIDNVGVTRVDLYIDGLLHGSDTTTPYSFFWDTTAAASGSHALLAVAQDASGNIGTSASTSVNIANNQVADTQPPSVSISAPVSVNRGAGNKLTVTVAASDNVGVASVQLYLDGSLVGTDTAAPYAFNLNTAKLSAGTHTLQAKAFDPSGNSGISAPVTLIK